VRTNREILVACAVMSVFSVATQSIDSNQMSDDTIMSVGARLKSTHVKGHLLVPRRGSARVGVRLGRSTDLAVAALRRRALSGGRVDGRWLSVACIVRAAYCSSINL
jgi:hypothetical protein